AAKRSARAAVAIAVALQREGLIDIDQALGRVTPAQLDVLLTPVIEPTALAHARVVASGLAACPGVVLLGEGPPSKVTKLLKQEEKKVARVAPGVPIHLWTVGDGEGQVPVKKISGKLTRMKPVLSKAETSVVNKRLTSLGGLRPPIPKGMDPMRARPDRKGMRGK
ncbi:MAG: DUF4191 family protein, partial [Ornithinibacter sp.]